MSFPQPEITALNKPYWEGLQEGRLMFQHCAHCGNNWLPARPHCPSCLSPDAVWKESKVGRVISWVVYHRAYADYFERKVPYDVTLVELDEGPRLLTNVVDSQAGKRLHEGAQVFLTIEHEEGFALAKFKIEKPAK